MEINFILLFFLKHQSNVNKLLILLGPTVMAKITYETKFNNMNKNYYKQLLLSNNNNILVSKDRKNMDNKYDYFDVH